MFTETWFFFFFLTFHQIGWLLCHLRIFAMHFIDFKLMICNMNSTEKLGIPERSWLPCINKVALTMHGKPKPISNNWIPVFCVHVVGRNSDFMMLGKRLGMTNLLLIVTQYVSTLKPLHVPQTAQVIILPAFFHVYIYRAVEYCDFFFFSLHK